MITNIALSSPQFLTFPSYEGGGGLLINGTLSSNYLLGGSGHDTIYGGGALAAPLDEDDTLVGAGGNDLIYGNGDEDIIYGDSSFNDVTGGNDFIYGGLGEDTIYGGGGNDCLFGNDDEDLLVGGYGHDTLIGGSGEDIFVFLANGGYDMVMDFSNSNDILSVQRTSTVQSFADLKNRITFDANGAFIDLGNSSGITIAGVSSALLDATDFFFWG